MLGLYKRAFYNECLLGSGQVLLTFMTHYYITDKELRDPEKYPSSLVNVERHEILYPYILAAQIFIHIIRIPLLLAYFKYPQISRCYIYV